MRLGVGTKFEWDILQRLYVSGGSRDQIWHFCRSYRTFPLGLEKSEEQFDHLFGDHFEDLHGARFPLPEGKGPTRFRSRWKHEGLKANRLAERHGPKAARAASLKLRKFISLRPDTRA